MKKIIILMMCLVFVCVFTSACDKKTKANMVQAKRRFEQYLPMLPQEDHNSNNNNVIRVDLSEGPKLQYNKNLGPKDVNFDFKVNVRY